MNTKEIGDFAEELAAEFLEKEGYLILDRKYAYKKLGEIDIIARSRGMTVFVEVRYRTSTMYGTPEASLSAGKLRKIRRTASMWRAINNEDETPCRFDVVAIDIAGGSPVLRHLKACF